MDYSRLGNTVTWQGLARGPQGFPASGPMPVGSGTGGPRGTTLEAGTLDMVDNPVMAVTRVWAR